MVRGGGFRTRWMLGIREALPSPADKEWFDRLFGYMVPAAAARLIRELPHLEAADSCRLLAPHFARHALGEQDLLSFWVRCLTADPRQQRLACLCLAHLGEAAAPHVASIARLLVVEPKQRRVAKHDLRASAIHALGAIGPPAREYLGQIAAFGDADDELVAAAANWALPRLRG